MTQPDFPKRSDKKYDDVMQYAKKNGADIAAYIVLFIGILLLLFQHTFLGGLLIGIVGGVYFADALIIWAKNMQNYVESEGIVRSLVFAGVFLGLFIAAPGIFIGAAAAIGVRQLFLGASR